MALLVALPGLFLPGFTLARAMRMPAAWILAFPLSAFLLTETVVVFSLMGVPIRFFYVAPVLAISTFACWLHQRSGVPEDLVEAAAPTIRRPGLIALRILILGQCVLILLGILFRTCCYPLSGYDTVFRWDALPRLMLKEQSLWFYPPVTSEDFALYTFPDAIPPLTSTVYWWLYAGWGAPWPALTSVAVTLQAVSCFALVYFAARSLFGMTGGLIALAAVSSSTLFLSAVAIGQETGYTALSCAGQLYVATLVARRPRIGAVVLMGLFAGLGALGRDYGPALTLIGLVALANQPTARRYLPLFCTVSLLSGGLWYLRNWLHTGNPLYPMNIGLGLPYNAVHAGVHGAIGEMMGMGNFTTGDWGRIARTLVLGAPLPIVIGIIGALVGGRKTLPMVVAVVVVVLLWLWSIPYTGGGVEYSMRVLSPAWIALSIATGAAVPLLDRATRGGRLLVAVATVAILVPCGVYAAMYAWAHPFDARQVAVAIGRWRPEPLGDWGPAIELAEILESSRLPWTNILVEDCYLAMALKEITSMRPVMIWDPEVAFLFDSQRSGAEARRRLRDMGIFMLAIGGGPNAEYLGRYPLFRDDRPHWQLIAFHPKTQHVYYLPPD